MVLAMVRFALLQCPGNCWSRGKVAVARVARRTGWQSRRRSRYISARVAPPWPEASKVLPLGGVAAQPPHLGLRAYRGS